jgi:hypothetical protein
VPANTPFVVVDGPRFTPLGYGLLAAAQVVDDPNPHWQVGTKFQPDACDAGKAVTTFCVAGGPATGTGEKIPTVTGAGSSAAEPFTVYAFHNCSPVGWGDDLTDYQARATRQLDRGEGRVVERMFWTGTPDVGPTIFPHLAHDATVTATADGASTVTLQTAASVVTGGTAVTPVVALSLLEGALASCYGGEGVIHVPFAAVALLAEHGLLRVQGPQLRTLGGHIVAAHAAGSTHGPNGSPASAGEAWWYATGAVVARRSAIKPTGVRSARDFLGRRDNSTVFVVERTFVIDWDCCHFAAQVDMAGGA